MFQSRCSVCHSIGNGDKIGPDLAGVTKRRERSWVARYLMNPDKMRAEGDPIALELAKKYQTARMPDQKLGGADLTQILAYLEAQSNAPGKTTQSNAPGKTAQKDTTHEHDHVH